MCSYGSVSWEDQFDYFSYFSEKKKKKVKKSPNEEAESSSLDPSCFVANVPPSSLRYDSMVF